MKLAVSPYKYRKLRKYEREMIKSLENRGLSLKLSIQEIGVADIEWYENSQDDQKVQDLRSAWQQCVNIPIIFVLDNGAMLDGHHRLLATCLDGRDCTVAGVVPSSTFYVMAEEFDIPRTEAAEIFAIINADLLEWLE